MFDSIKYDLQQDKSWFVCLDGKNSVIRDMRTKLFGLQLGYLYNHRTNLYIGYYSTDNHQTRIIENPSAQNGNTDSNTVFLKYNLAYFNFGCEYYFYNTEKWRMSFPVALGIGMGNDQTYTIKKTLVQHSKTVVPLDIGFTVNYKIKWWVWAGAGIGTRLSLASSKYNGPYYYMGLSLRTGEMYYRARAWYRHKKY